ncbi:MAG: cobalamin-dependent protein [Acidobacteria bacterium]|nr:cobalamin-dependent protein [Acidobacteriota bacterium]
MNSESLNVKLLHCGNLNIANPEDNLEKNAFFIPMGLFALAKLLKENGFNVEIIHLDIEIDKNIEEILDFNSLDAVGFDCHWVNQSLAVLNTAELIKKIKPGVFVFLGGFTASYFAQEILREHPYIDAIVRGDAESPLLELFRVLYLEKMAGQQTAKPGISDTHDRFADVPNLVWRENNKQLRLNEFSYVASGQDLDKLDFCEMTLLRNWEIYQGGSRFYSKFHHFNSVPRFIVCIGRGCIYGCSFCGGNNQAQVCINNRKGQCIRSLDTVFASIKKAISFGYTSFHFDYYFENSEEYFIRLFNRIKAEKIDITISFVFWGIPSLSIIDTISQCFSQALIGISPETADHGLRKSNKDSRLFYTNKELEECLQHIDSKKNLKTQLYFGYFLPFDTEETVYGTLAYIEKLMLKYAHFAELFYGNFSTDPASLLFLDPGKYDIDINPRSFNDYLTLLQQNFLLKKGGSPDITAFKPRKLSNETVAILGHKIRLFNDLRFCFETSIKLLSEKVSKSPVISDYLREVEIPVTGKSNFELDEIKGILLNICKEHNILDHELLTSIGREFEAAKSPSALKLRQFYSHKSYSKDLLEDGADDKKKACEKPTKNEKTPVKIKFQEDAANFDFE